MFCTQCGRALPPGVRFCTGCGSALGAAAPAPLPPGAGPTPPDLHWAAVVALTIVTFGLFWFFWNYRVAAFVRKIDPASKAVKQASLMIGIMILQFAIWTIMAVLAIASNSDAIGHGLDFSKIIESAVGLINLYMVISMRRSLEWYYNNKEPIGLQLNQLMTLIFGVVYLQFHLSIIAACKRSQLQAPYAQAGAPARPAY